MKAKKFLLENENATQLEIFHNQIKLSTWTATLQLGATILILIIAKRLRMLESGLGIHFLVCVPSKLGFVFSPAKDPIS